MDASAMAPHKMPPGAVPPSAEGWSQAGFVFRVLDGMVYWGGAVSILTGQAWRWVDLRFAGGHAMQAIFPPLWLVSLLGLYWLRYPWRVSPKPLSLEQLNWRRRLAHVLSLPSWLLLAALLYNTHQFYNLMHSGRVNTTFHIPMCLLVATILAAWLGAKPWNVTGFEPELLPPPLPGMRLLTPRWADRVIVGLWAALVVVIFCFLFRANPPPRSMVCDVAVVLGNDTLPHDVCGWTAAARTRKAIDLYKQGRVRMIMLSANAPYGITNPRQNAPLAMAKLCRAAGVPQKNLVLDFYGDNTRYSAWDTLQLKQRYHWKTIVVVSSDYHLPRARLAYRQFGMKVYTVASRHHVWRQTSIFAVVHELVGYVVYYFDRNYHHPVVRQP